MTAKSETDFFQLIERLGYQERHRGERSYALPRRCYGNPADFVKFGSEKGKTMRQVAKYDDSEMDNREPVDKVLDIWADYMRLKDRAEPGGYSNPQDVKDFMRLGEAVDAMVNDLKRYQWWAIRKSKGLCTQWIFRDEVYERALMQAKEILGEKMRRHVAMAKYFN